MKAVSTNCDDLSCKAGNDIATNDLVLIRLALDAIKCMLEAEMNA